MQEVSGPEHRKWPRQHRLIYKEATEEGNEQHECYMSSFANPV